MIIQLCGMSGAGKTSLSEATKKYLETIGVPVEIIDADDYRTHVLKELGYSKADRNENIRRLAFIANKFNQHGIVTIICAINPYEAIRQEIKSNYYKVYTVFVSCDLQTLTVRDTKGLYKKAQLPANHSEKVTNLTGVNDPFEVPANCDLVIATNEETLDVSTQRFVQFIQDRLEINL
jgi:adenylylsulfate kinase